MTEQGFITHTVTSVDIPGKGTIALTRSDAEDERSLIRHVDAFRRSNSSPTLHSAFGSADCHTECHRHYRWSWETLSADGTRSTDTVWATRV